MKVNLVVYENLRRLGITPEDAETLISLAKSYHRWDEACCENIEIDDDGTAYFNNGVTRYKVRNREISLDKRLDKIKKKYPSLWFYRQSDPRGASLFIGQTDSIEKNIDAEYYKGIAVY